MIRRISLTALAVFVTFAGGLAASAQPLADRIPADAVVYVGWAGADSMGPGYDGSHLKAMLEAGQVPQFINEVVPKLFERVAQEEPDAAKAAEVGKAVMLPMWRHPTALYVGPVDMANPRKPMPRFAVLCDAGEDAPEMQRQLDELVKEAAKNAPVPLGVRTVGNLVVVTVGRTPELDAVIDGKSKTRTLGAAKNFAAVTSVQKSPVLAAYADVEAVIKFVDDAVAKGNDAEAKKNWPAARDALGLRGLKRISLAQGFDGKDWGTHAFIEAPAPRQGLMAAIDAEPVGDEMLRAIPAASTLAGVARLDLARLFDGVRGAVAKLDPDGAEEMDEGIQQVNAMIGMDLRKDLLAALGDQWAYFVAPEITGRGPLGIVVVNRLKDAKKAEDASAKLTQLANDLIAAQADPDAKISFKQGKVGDVTVRYLATPFASPAWTIGNGNLYVALYPQLVAQAAGHVSREGKSILDNEGFVALRKRLGGERAVSFQFYDLPRSAPTSYQVWLLASSFAKVGDVLGVDTPPALLPPLGKLLEHLTVAGAVSWVDERGMHLRAVTPFPGSTVIASETGGLLDVQTSALGMSILLPSLTRARDQANRVKSMSNLRQIGLGAMLYANENKGKLPDDLGTLQGSGDLTLEVFVNPQTNNAVPPGLEGDAAKRWLNEQSDYVYVGKGQKTNDPGTAQRVLAYERPGTVSEGLNILFADGHVEWMPMHRAMQVIEKGKQ